MPAHCTTTEDCTAEAGGPSRYIAAPYRYWGPLTPVDVGGAVVAIACTPQLGELRRSGSGKKEGGTNEPVAAFAEGSWPVYCVNEFIMT